MFKLSKSKNLDLLSLYKNPKHLFSDSSFLRRRRRLKIAMNFLKYFSVLLIIVAFFTFLSSIFYLKDLKYFYESALSGKRNIEKSVSLVLAEQYEEGRVMAKLAADNFADATQIAQKYNKNFLFKHISYFKYQIDDLVYLMTSAEIISQAIEQSTVYAQTVEAVLSNKEKNFNKLSETDRIKLLDTLYKSSPELTGIKANIDLALINLDYISFTGILIPFKSKINDLKEKLVLVNENLDTIIPLSQFIPVMLGYPEKSDYLLILQNNDELRPSGGFIGTYGISEALNGDIVKLDTHDVYHLDMPVKDVFTAIPPEALKTYLGVDKWYFRDANWSPDWPSSAKNVEKFFYAEDKLLPEKDQVNDFEGEFEGVIAITPDIIENLLEVIGPIYVEGSEFNSLNFVNLLQYKVEQEYIQLGKRSWHRKEVIGEIVKELKIKMFDLSPRDMYSVLKVFKTSLDNKDIQIYFSDQDLQSIVSEKGWAGEVVQNKEDYLMVVDANMAAYKTDAVMTKAINYNVSESSSAEVLSNLRISYAHNGSFDWKTTRYRTYTRVYVPKGSELIRSKGMEEDSVEIYDELGKTVFAYFLSVEPGAMASVVLDYKLPQNIENSVKNGEYSLYIQKQAGNNVGELTVQTKFAKDILGYTPNGFLATKIDKQNLVWDTKLVSDIIFNLKLNKK